MTSASPPFVFLGNVPWLDFINTQLQGPRGRLELLPDAQALIRWGAESGVIDQKESKEIAARLPLGTGGQQLLAEIGKFRRDLRRAADCLVNEAAVPESVVAHTNEILGRTLEAPLLRRCDAGWKIVLQPAQLDAQVIVARVARNFADFLVAVDLTRLHRCASDTCAIYFYDTSKNRTRRWCSMEYCGNRAKAAEHRARHR